MKVETTSIPTNEAEEAEIAELAKIVADDANARDILICPSAMADGRKKAGLLLKVFHALRFKSLFISYDVVRPNDFNTADEKKALAMCVDASGVSCCYSRAINGFAATEDGPKCEVTYHDAYRTLRRADFVFNDAKFVVPPGDILVDRKMLQENQGIPWLEALQDDNRAKYMTCLTFCELVIDTTAQRPYYSPYPYRIICTCMHDTSEPPCNVNMKNVLAVPEYKKAVEDAIILLKQG